MKKIISILLSLVMVVSVSVTSVSAFALVSSQQTTKKTSNINLKVNGKYTKKDITYKEDPEGTYTFTYDGDGDVKDWKIEGMEEGKDYKVISKDGKTIKIELLNGFSGDFTIDAEVEEKTTEPSEDEDEDEEDEEETEKKAKKDKSGKSPKTGATAATGIAAAGAGAAILLALRKKNEDAE